MPRAFIPGGRRRRGGRGAQGAARPASAERLVPAGHVTLGGDTRELDPYASVVDAFDADFPIVTP